jgi:hypothetical protein
MYFLEKKNPITLFFTGYGHYRVTMRYKRKLISIVTDDMQTVDNYNDDNSRRHNAGYKALRSMIIRAYTFGKDWE